MGSGRRSLVLPSLRVILRATLVLVFLDPLGPSVAKDWKAPEKYVGLSGQIGSYEEVQRNLEHLEWQEVGQTNEKATLSLKELHDGQLAWRNALQNVEVVFDYSLQRRLITARVMAEKQQERAVPDNFAFEAQIAMEGEKRFTDKRETTPANSPNSQSLPAKRPSKTIPEFVYAYNGSEMKSFEPFRSIGHIHRAKLDAVDSNHMWYFDSLSIPTGSRAGHHSESVWYVPVALSLPTVYRVLPTLQTVDGFRCHVATSGPDTIWIDAEHGFCMRRRVWFQVKNLTLAPVLAFVYVNKDFREHPGHIWMPQQCYRLDFAGTSEPENTRGFLTEVNTVTAKTINVNTVSDDLFDFAFPAGTNVFDLVKNKAYVVPRGEHLLDEAIAQADPIVNGEVRPRRSGTGPGLVWRQVLVLNAVVLLVVGGGMVWYRRYRRANG